MEQFLVLIIVVLIAFILGLLSAISIIGPRYYR
jgi:hypothetical protein